MLLLDRYISKAIIQAVIIVSVLIMGVVTLLTILAELKNLGHGDYRILQLFSYVIMRLPSELYHFSPMIILLGTIGGLLMLTRSNELIVMRASGLSSFRIIMSILLSAFSMIVLIALIGEIAGPKLSLIAVMQKENARNAEHAIVTKSGVWFHINDEFIHADQIISKHFLQGVTRYQFDHQRRLTAVYAASQLVMVGHHWQLQNVKKTSFLSNATRSEQIGILPWNVKLNTELFNDIIEPSEMSLHKLAQFSSYLKHNGLQASNYEYAFWQRLFQPFVNLLMVLIAIPFAFNATNRSQYGWQIMAGILLGIIFFIGNAFLEQVCIVYQLPALSAALIPLFILGALSYLYVRRVFR